MKQLVPATGKLLRNATFMWNSLALTVSILYIQGSSAFIAKIINLKFAVDYQTIGIVLGSIFTPTGIGKRIKYILLYDMICDIYIYIYLLLAECKVRTASYGPRFFLPFMAQARSARAMKTRKEKTSENICF